MQLFGGDKWEAFREIEAHLVSKDAQGSGAGSVGFARSRVTHVLHQVQVLLHVRRRPPLVRASGMP